MTFTEILAEARRLAKQTSTSYPTSEVTTSANRALERVTSLIRDAEGRWQWDDSNNSDFPFATTAITTDIQDYSLDPSHYRIERMEIKDTEGNWHKLDSIDTADVYDQSLTDFLKTSGLPKYYDKVGNSVLLYPKPNYTQAASLKVFYERGPDYFETTDTTKTPGFNTLFHSLVPLWAAYDFAFINQLPTAKSIADRIALMEDDLKDYYSLRDKDDRIQLRSRIIRYK